MWRDGHNGKASAVIGWRSCPLGGTLIQHRHEPIRSDRLRVARGKLRGRGLRHELPQSFRRDLVEFMKGRERPDAPRILSILNDDQSFFHVNQWPLGFADLFLAQCRCHGISDDPSHSEAGSSAETSMPCTAAACVMIVRMKDKSIANVAGPARCLARFLPNSISRSRLSAGSFTLPSSVLSDAITAASDRRGAFQLAHVFAVQVDQVTKCANVPDYAWLG